MKVQNTVFNSLPVYADIKPSYKDKDMFSS